MSMDEKDARKVSGAKALDSKGNGRRGSRFRTEASHVGGGSSQMHIESALKCPPSNPG